MGSFWKDILKGASKALGAIEDIPLLGQFAKPVLGFATGTMDSAIQNQETKDMYNRQYDYQTSLMQYNNVFNEHMFDRQLEANKQSIVDQFNQYRQIGINPLALSGGMTQTPMANSLPGSIGSPLPNDSPLQAAEVGLLRAQAAKTQAEANVIEPQANANIYSTMTMAQRVKTLLGGELQLLNGKIITEGWKGELTRKQVDLAFKEIDNVEANTNAITLGFEGITADNLLKRINALTYPESLSRQWSLMETQEKTMIQHSKNETKQVLGQITRWCFENAESVARALNYNQNTELQAAQTENQRQTNYEQMITSQGRIKLQNSTYDFQLFQNNMGKIQLALTVGTEMNKPQIWRQTWSNLGDITRALNFGMGFNFGYNQFSGSSSVQSNSTSTSTVGYSGNPHVPIQGFGH